MIESGGYHCCNFFRRFAGVIKVCQQVNIGQCKFGDVKCVTGLLKFIVDHGVVLGLVDDEAGMTLG